MSEQAVVQPTTGSNAVLMPLPPDRRGNDTLRNTRPIYDRYEWLFVRQENMVSAPVDACIALSH